MQISLRNEIILLTDGKPLAIRGARGIILECTDGLIWLTVKGLPYDFWLVKGERLIIENNELALVEGFTSGAIRLISESSNSIHRTIVWR